MCTRASIYSVLCVCVLCILLPSAIHAQSTGLWYAGVWDSSIYNRSMRPQTVALRIEIVDSDTKIPLQGVVIRLWGKYLEEWMGRSGEQNGMPLEPQEKEFKLEAVTGADGVVVFALGWRKEWPWSTYFRDAPPRDYKPDGSWTEKESWIAAVDDIEKVQRIEIRHARYRYREIPLSFKHLTEFGQRKWTATQEPDLFRKFEEAWQNEIKRQDVRFFVLDLTSKFPDFQKKHSRRPEFFEKIRQEDWGAIYKEPHNWFSTGEQPQSQCGPYFAYLLDDIPLERVAAQIEVSTP